MMKLTTNSEGKPPKNPIYNHGANIVSICCQIPPAKQPEYHKSLEFPLTTIASDDSSISIEESVHPEDQPPGPSTVLFTIIPVDPNIPNECSIGNEHTRLIKIMK